MRLAAEKLALFFSLLHEEAEQLYREASSTKMGSSQNQFTSFTLTSRRQSLEGVF